MDERKQPTEKDSKKDDLITDLSQKDFLLPPPRIFPYRGIRLSWFAYHPAVQGIDEFSYMRSQRIFLDQWNEWCKTVELYRGEMTLSEKVVVPQLKKDAAKVLKEIDVVRDPHMLEAMAMTLWDKSGATQDETGKFIGSSEKILRHEFVTMREMNQIAKELRHQDTGMTTGFIIPANQLVRRTWSG